MLDYRTFGYRRIKVLRPLRMSLHIEEAGLDKLKADKTWLKLSPEHQGVWEEALLGQIGATHPFGWAETFAAGVVQSALAAEMCIRDRVCFVQTMVGEPNGRTDRLGRITGGFHLGKCRKADAGRGRECRIAGRGHGMKNARYELFGLSLIHI